MDIAAQTAVKRVTPGAETRIASYLLTEYLERLGVEVIFGLCGHTAPERMGHVVAVVHPATAAAPPPAGGVRSGRC